MKTPIDVIYLNKNNEIIKIDPEVPTGICCKKSKAAKVFLNYQVAMQQNWDLIARTDWR